MQNLCHTLVFKKPRQSWLKFQHGCCDSTSFVEALPFVQLQNIMNNILETRKKVRAFWKRMFTFYIIRSFEPNKSKAYSNAKNSFTMILFYTCHQ